MRAVLHETAARPPIRRNAVRSQNVLQSVSVSPQMQRTVVFHGGDEEARPAGHDRATKRAVAARLAEVLGWPFRAETDATLDAGASLYVVPCDTVVGLQNARRLGIRGPEDVFGGVVPQAFVATKAISHSLVTENAFAPPGWSHRLGARIEPDVLPGYTCFDLHDVREAGARLLPGGSVRLKDPAGVGGSSQWVLRTLADLDRQLQALDAGAVRQRGMVVERNLNEVVTHSVGQAVVGPFRLAYHGMQSTTLNHRGDEVYGGSQLTVTRGGLEQVLEMSLPADVRTAVEQALRYHHAAFASFDGLFASRCNYDIAQGVDDRGTRLSGVLEQSWRIGGASGAEVAALAAFVDDPALKVVRTSIRERYGSAVQVPPTAWLLFEGVDPRVGPITKFAQVHHDAHD